MISVLARHPGVLPPGVAATSYHEVRCIQDQMRWVLGCMWSAMQSCSAVICYIYPQVQQSHTNRVMHAHCKSSEAAHPKQRMPENS